MCHLARIRVQSLPALISIISTLRYNLAMLPYDFAYRLKKIKERMVAAATRAGRDAGDITLVAVTKNRPPELVQAAYEAGLRDFGENRVAEMRSKQDVLTLPGARWHCIGHIQRRKVRQLIGHSDLVHSIDRLSLAEELSKRAAAAKMEIHGLLQVNSSGEENKGGWHVHAPAGQEAFLRDVEQILALPNLHVHGLMTMAPFYDKAEETRSTFATTYGMLQMLIERFPVHSFNILSMGMTNDFEVAIEEGATHVRLGTALFGPRN